MVSKVYNRGKLAGLASICLVIALAGCQSGDALGALNLGGASRDAAPDDRITAAEVMAYCPSVTVPQAGAVYNSYQRGGEGDPARLNFRASVIDATRSCSYGDGMMGMTIAVAGRVVPGPAGASGTVRVPLRITVYQNTEMIYSQTHEHDVTLGAGASQFMITDANFSMPNPTARNVRVLAAYDQPAAPRR